ncbi:WD repeat and FYVE domain-containing protein 1 [Cichlidogyrus casuarinus]|uniref:WD repeat and FYVE domain-containing protein 1 n=1 Tax=Cichlidogyrus casuarinus TaxID=1844966 RepID=A0ABD2PZE9_9PLAT
MIKSKIINETWRPSVKTSITAIGNKVLDAVFVPNSETIIASSDNLSVAIYQKHDTKYWPSNTQVLPSNAHSLCVTPSPFKQSLVILFVGQENGTISEYHLTADTNSMTHQRDILAHTGKITGLAVDLPDEWLISVAEDKKLVLTCLKTNKILTSHKLDAAATCLAFDASVRYCFIGDTTGNITILSLKATSIDITIVNILKSHSAAITSVTWHETDLTLASSSKDNLVIIWDIRGSQALDLHAHKDVATSVAWWLQGAGKLMPQAKKSTKEPSILVSAGLDGKVIFWLNDLDRKESTKWKESNCCQLCGGAFIWNIKKIIEDACFGSMQHHCRRCGKAVCQKCSPHTSTLPSSGYETAVRVCKDCEQSATDDEKNSMAIIVDGSDQLTRIKIDESHNRMLLLSRSAQMKIMAFD